MFITGQTGYNCLVCDFLHLLLPNQKKKITCFKCGKLFFPTRPKNKVYVAPITDPMGPQLENVHRTAETSVNACQNVQINPRRAKLINRKRSYKDDTSANESDSELVAYCPKKYRKLRFLNNNDENLQKNMVSGAKREPRPNKMCSNSWCTWTAKPESADNRALAQHKRACEKNFHNGKKIRSKIGGNSRYVDMAKIASDTSDDCVSDLPQLELVVTK
jgi:hypothetical protein